MPSTGLQVVVTVAAVVGFVAYFVALHTLLVLGTAPTLVVAMIVAPWVLVVAPAIVRRMRAARGSRRVAILVGAFIVVVVAGWAIDRFGAALGRHAETVLYVENLAFFGWLASLFAASLGGDGEPLVTRMARKTRRGDMPPSVLRYTRTLTVAWALFLVLLMMVSTGLFFTQSRAIWSLYINVLMWPIVGAAFVAEYLVRLAVLRDIRHVPFSAAFHAFRERSDDA